MSYIESVIMPNESVVITARTHWFIYIYPLFLLALATIALYFLHYYLGGKWRLFSLPLYLFAAYEFLRAWIYSYSTELAVTNKRVIAKFGFIRRYTTELKHNKVESVQVNQSILGRIFNFGSVKIIGSGGTSAPIPYIKNPLTFRSAALTQEDSLNEKD